MRLRALLLVLIALAVPAASFAASGSLTASPASVVSGASTKLSWSTSGATGIIVEPINFRSESASGSTIVTPTATTTYTLWTVASGGVVTAVATATVTVAAAGNKPTINSFTASPASIASGSSSTLAFSTTGATSVAISPGTFTSSSAGGSTSVSPTATTTYTLTATNSAGAVTATATVTVTNPSKAASLTASPATIPSGSGSTLTYSAPGAVNIVIEPVNFRSGSASGSTVVTPTATTTYTLWTVSSDDVFAAVATATVTVAAGGNKPTINSFTASPASIKSGSSSTLAFSTTGATSVTISPGTFNSSSASGSTTVEPTATTTYTLTATNSAGSATSTATVTVTAAGSVPTIGSFTASPASIVSGSSSTLSWATSGAASVAITPGSFTSASPSGSTSVSPTATTTYTLTATDSTGSVTATTKVTVTSSAPSLTITTTSCPGGTQNAAYAGCMIVATGGKPPYTFTVDTSGSSSPLPEGLSLDESSGAITAPIIGGQGSYTPKIFVTDSNGTQATASITFSLSGSNAFLTQIFPANSIFHHRVDAATTGLPVDSSPAAPIYSAYQSATVKPFFGNAAYETFPNGIPAFEVPYNQPDVDVSTTLYQSYFTLGPIPAYAPVEGTSYSGGDRHVLVYLEPGPESTPALYEMWQAIYEGGPWTDSSNALWPDVAGNNLTPQGNGTSDAAGLPVAPFLVNADEVIGTGTPAAPNGVVKHPIRFTVNHMVNYWVWPATQTAGEGYCTQAGANIPTESEISQSSPPSTCSVTGPAGEIYRLKASVPTPACAAASPQAAIIIAGFRDYGIILADNGDSGGLIGTPDARWNDSDLSCLTSLTLSDFEPVNVSSLMVSNDSGQTSK